MGDNRRLINSVQTSQVESTVAHPANGVLLASVPTHTMARDTGYLHNAPTE
jgi:hypothetical protein